MLPYSGVHECFVDKPREDVISNHTIQAGDVIVGLASYGQATG